MKTKSQCLVTDVGKVSASLQELQRERAVILKSSLMQSNRLRAVIAGTLGYHSSMAEGERKKKFQEAATLIDTIVAGGEGPLKHVVLATQRGIAEFDALNADLERRMKKLVRGLPVYLWACLPAQRGFGELHLAQVVGECGDLHNYANPAKVWRRLGCAPWTFEGSTQMGQSWRVFSRDLKLPAAEWVEYAYSPRRRSIAYNIGEGLCKQNGAGKPQSGGDDLDPETEDAPVSPRPCGPYRARYDAAKVTFKETHPEATPIHCHKHGMLLATKLLLKNLWIEWNR